MDIISGSEVSRQFISSIGVITSQGIFGHDIMACEWSYQISYKPGLVSVSVNPKHATHEQIMSSGEFGLGICSYDQSVLASVAGKDSGRNYDKIRILKELGFRFYPALHIDTLLAEGTASNMECKTIQVIHTGDHTMFIGEVLHATHTPEKMPLVYHGGSYWKLETHIEKPSQEYRRKIQELYENHKK